MRKLVTVGLVSALLASIVVATTTAALPKPKPWHWTPAKAAVRLTALNPFMFHDIKGVESSTCVGRGRGRAGRFSAFQCEITTSLYKAPVLIRVLPVGSGKLCVVSTPEGNAVLPGITTKAAIMVAAGRACPSA